MDSCEAKSTALACDKKRTEQCFYLMKKLGLSEEKKLTLLDERTITEDLEKDEDSVVDTVCRFFQELSSQDCKAAENLQHNYSKQNPGEVASSRDLLFTILTCCDPFLRQDIFRKLVSCYNAVPLLLPGVGSSELYFSVWELRKCGTHMYNSESGSVTYKNVVSYPFLTVTALRFGALTISKSDIMNAILMRLYGIDVHYSFLSQSHDCAKSKLSEGTVEAAWYTPTDTDSIQFHLCLLNVRGDATKYEKQVSFCAEISQAVIIFLDLSAKDYIKSIKQIGKLTSVVLVTPSSNEVTRQFEGSNISVLAFQDLSQSGEQTRISNKIVSKIANWFSAPSSPFKALEEQEAAWQKATMPEDEPPNKCSKGKSLASEFIDQFKLFHDKQKKVTFPLQGVLNAVVTVNTKKSADVDHGKKRESEKSNHQMMIENQRKTALSDAMKKFLSVILKKDKELVYFFLTWLQIFLNEFFMQHLALSFHILNDNFKKRRGIYKQVRLLKSSATKDWPQFRKNHLLTKQKEEKKETNEKEVKEKEKIYKKIVGMEHFICEIGQMVECSHQILFQGTEITGHALSRFGSEILINGYFLEICYTQNCYVPEKWVSSVLKELHNSLQNKPRVRVVSILGGSNSGKSYILNNIFGTNFPEEEDRCSRDVRMAIVPVHNSMQNLLLCNFLLIIDTESVSVSEMTSQLALKRNNYISTLVSCISDVILISIGKENTPEENFGLFNIALRGMQKRKDIGETVKACIIQHYREKDKHSKEDIHEKLREVVTKQSQEKSTSNSPSKTPEMGFNTELLSFFSLNDSERDSEKNIKFVNSLDLRCSSKQSLRHATEIKHLRYYILRMLKNVSCNPCYFPEIGERITDLAQLLDEENFAEAFQTYFRQKKCKAFVLQCTQRILSIEKHLNESLLNARKETVTAYCENKESVDEMFTLKVEDLKKISKLEFDILKNKMSEEQEKQYLQDFACDMQELLSTVEKAFSASVRRIEGTLEETVNNIKKFDCIVTKWKHQLSNAESDLASILRMSCDKLGNVRLKDFDDMVTKERQKLEKEAQTKLEKLKHEMKHELSQVSSDIESMNKLKPNIDSALTNLKTQLFNNLLKRASEIKSVMSYNNDIEERISNIETELNNKLVEICSEIRTCAIDVDDLLEMKKIEINELVQKQFCAAQQVMEDKGKHLMSFYPNYEDYLKENIQLAQDRFMIHACSQLEIITDEEKSNTKLLALSKPAKMLQNNLTKDYKFSDEFCLNFNDKLSAIQWELQLKVITFCSLLRCASSEKVKDLLKMKESELTELATCKFKAISERFSEDKGNKPEKESQYKVVEKSIKSTKERFVTEMKAKLKQTAEAVVKKQKNKKKVSKEANKMVSLFLENIPKDSKKESIKEMFAKDFQRMVERVTQENPLPSICDIKVEKKNETLSKLKDRIDKKFLPKDKDLSYYATTSISIESKDDVLKLSNSFCENNERTDIAFQHLTHDLTNLCEDYLHFKQNATKAIEIVHRFENECTLLVERISLFTFLCSKFLSETHKMHLRAEISFMRKENIVTEFQTKSESSMIRNDYVIKHAEPLQFPSLDSKIQYIASALNGNNMDEEYTTFARSLTATTVKNCDSLSFNVDTIRGIDAFFIRVLPLLKGGDMNSLFKTVSSVKLSIIGKTLSKVSHDFNHYFSDISNSVENTFMNSKGEEEAKAAALTHLSAWSSNFIAVKEFEEAKENSIPEDLSKTKPMCMIEVYKHCDQSCDELIAQVLCDEVENTLEIFIEEIFLQELSKTLSKETREFSLKRTFIGKILRDCITNDNYQGFLTFANNYEKLCEESFIDFLAIQCNNEKASLLEHVKVRVITTKVEAAIKALDVTMKHFESKMPGNFSTWLSQFKLNFVTNVKTFLTENELSVLESKASIRDIHNFTEVCREGIGGLVEKFKKESNLPPNGNHKATVMWLMSLPKSIHGDLSKFVKGCTQQCPFCGHPCEESLGDHETHQSTIHIPRGLKGSKDTGTKVLTPTICNYAVNKGTGKYKVKGKEGYWHSYEKDFPDWNIPGFEDQPISLWRYIFRQFNQQFAEYYEGEAGISTEWDHVDKDDAIHSIDEFYFHEVTN